MRRGIFERGEDEDALGKGKGVWGRDDGVEVDVADRLGGDFDRFVAVEDDGCLHMGVPSSVLVLRHVHG